MIMKRKMITMESKRQNKYSSPGLMTILEVNLRIMRYPMKMESIRLLGITELKIFSFSGLVEKWYLMNS
jgi:hypothetical protein